ncbi:MAG: aromatic ring-hydroxylating dioxygenase subunit alpha [Gammaproteobacteria bacterium]
MYINFWYAATTSESVADTPLRVRMLGQDFVLFRDSSGAIACLADTCIHRGASLGHGKVKDGCIQCPYHGWRFDRDGRCTLIPSLGAGARIPARARVDAYPVVERYGLVFAFLGDLSEEQRPPIVEIPEWNQAGWRTMLYVYDWSAHFQRSVENSLDAPHVDFVHDFGGLSNTSFKLEPERSVVEERGAWGAVHLIETKTQLFEHGHSGVSHTWTWLTFGKAPNSPKFLFYTFITPVDETRVRRFLIQARNVQLDPKVDEQLRPANDSAEREDRVVIEKLRPAESPTDTQHEFMVADDAIMVRYRERLREWEQRGWRIDTEAVNRQRQRFAFAIPGPTRRQGGSWVLDPIPLRAPDERSSAAWSDSLPSSRFS